ncbi:S8 family serine peptidase [Brevibacillus nitrificans]|uniref:S8 family serine peptidase n=1 Tax=Brevibacillus nitrificans TaxID=651560 RepID=UPI0028648A23|nr:S8 family serine peptidase [Brevibacillus nitrificans]MDR7314907.1 subtilisin family serine protease [Brevibacillus nitrificans]
MKKKKLSQFSKILAAWAVTASLFSGMVGPIAVQAEEGVVIDPNDIIPGEVIVRYKEGVGTNDLNKSLRMSISSVDDVEVTEENGAVIALQPLEPGEEIEEVIAQLEDNPIVEYAEPNLKYRALVSSINDTYYDQQWGFKDVKAEEGWQLLNGVSGSVTVAVVDTGVDANHPDLAGKVLAGKGKNFAIKKGSGEDYPENRDADDDEGHGTLVSGVIAAVSNNGVGITGVAGAAQVNILPVKVMNEKGYGSSYDIANGIRYAADEGASVINLSLGSDSYSRVIDEAVTYAQSKGTLVVAAAGNDGKNVDRYYPASLPGVVTVGAISSNGKIASFSNYGNALELVAPGEGILSTAISAMGDNLIGNETDGYYKQVSGTSFSAPHVAAAAAMYRLLHPDATPAEVTSTLTTGATDIAPAGWDKTYGYGKLNVPNTLSPSAEPQWTVLLQQPAENSLVVDTQTLKAEIVKKQDIINKLSFYLDQVESTSLIKEVAAHAGQSLYQADWDTTTAQDGSHKVIVVAYQDSTEVGRYETTVNVRNNAQSGLLIKVLDPQQNPAVNATVSLYAKSMTKAEETEPSVDASKYSYELIWSGQTSSGGAARIPSSIAHDLTPYTVVVQGQFDFPNAPDGSTLYLYQRTVEGPAEITIDSANTVPVKLTSTDQSAAALPTASYFATAVDANQVVIGTIEPLNDKDKTNAPTIYLDKGKYNLFAYSKTNDTTYFQSKWGVSITKANELAFDGRDTGEVTLSTNKESDRVVDGVLYLYDEGSEQSLGLNQEVLVGQKLRVSTGSYNYWVDVEVEDPNGSNTNWIYVFDSAGKKLQVRSGQKAEVKVGGGLTLDYFTPDLAALKTYVERLGMTYKPDTDDYHIRKNYGIYYTKQQFSDHYQNALVGMYRGTLSANGIWQRVNHELEKLEVLALDTDDQEWSVQEYYFGDLHANLKVTNKATNYEVYDSSKLSNLPGLRQFFWMSFWAVSRPDVTPGEYQIDLTLDDNPLAGGPLAATMTNIVHDDNIVSMKVTDGTTDYIPYVWIYHADQEASGEYTWEKSFGQWADRTKTSPNYKQVLINSEIDLSDEPNGNLAIIRFENTDGKYAFLFKSFTNLQELQGNLVVDKNKLHLVTLQANDENGDAIQAAKSTFGVLYPATIDGEQLNFRHLLGADYKKGMWLVEGSYHFDGQFVTLPDSQRRISNYYFLKKM